MYGLAWCFYSVPLQNNWRGISLWSVVGKLYGRVVIK